MYPRHRSFRQSRFLRSKPTKRHFFKSFITQRPVRRLHAHTQPLHDANNSRVVIRIILGLLFLNIVIIGGVLLHKRMSNPDDTQTYTNPALAGGAADPKPPAAPAKKKNPEITKGRDEARNSHVQNVTPKPPKPMVVVAPEKKPEQKPEQKPENTPKVTEIVAVVDKDATNIVVTPSNRPNNQPSPAKPLILPPLDNTPAAQEGANSYVAVVGDNWENIAAKRRVSVAELKKANPSIAKLNVIRPNDKLIIPPPSIAPGKVIEATPAIGGPVKKTPVVDPTLAVNNIDPTHEMAAITYDEPPQLKKVEIAADDLIIGNTDPAPAPIHPLGTRQPNEVVAEAEPDTPTPATKTATYKVRRGDTMGAIAKRHGMKLNDLLKLNGISKKNAHRLKIGQRLKVKRR